MPPLKASSKTHVGMVRVGNEDCFFSNDDLGLWLVADGMGGHEAGEVASAIVAKTVADAVAEGKDLASAIQFSHQAVLDGGLHGEGARGMGSTIVAVQQLASGNWLLAWVGDSRAYLWTRLNDEESQIQLISRDHSYVQALIDAGAISEAEADNHPDKNVITQCLGSVEMPSVRVDTVCQNWQKNQKIILCSDGLSDEVSDGDIARILNENPNSSKAVDALIDQALKNGGKDNVTVVVIDGPGEQQENETSQADDDGLPSRPAVPWQKVAMVAGAALVAAVLAGLMIHYFG